MNEEYPGTFEETLERYLKHLSLYLPRPMNWDIMDKLQNLEIGQAIVKCSVDFAINEASHAKLSPAVKQNE